MTLSSQPLWATIDCQTRSGVAGMSMWRTPRWASASTTAFWTAGVAPIVPDSPIPLAPSGLRGVGVSWGMPLEAGQLGRRDRGRSP